jgi:hypothetical protein
MGIKDVCPIRSTVAATLVAVTLAAAVHVATPRAEAAPVCPNVRVMGTAIALFRERSKKQARGHWEAMARRKYRTSRISWWNGREPAYSCRWVRRSGFRCFAFAKPCF